MDLFGLKAKRRQKYLSELRYTFYWCGIHNCALNMTTMHCEKCREEHSQQLKERKEFLLREVGGAW